MQTNLFTMGSKSQRIHIIRELIDSELISSQEELLIKLKERGIETTQSTLSRDLKFLKVAKISNRDKGYVYVIPNNLKGNTDSSVSSIITDNITGLDFSGNIAVIRTKPGYANAVTVLIDNENYFEVLGTIAGDDTIFIVLREGASRTKFIDALSSIHSNIGTLYKK